MRQNIIITFIVIFAIVIAMFWYRYDKDANQQQTLQQKNASKLFFFQEEKAIGWRISYGNQEIVAFKTNDASWQSKDSTRYRWMVRLTEKHGNQKTSKTYPADFGTVFANIKNFNTIELLDVVATNTSTQTTENIQQKWGLQFATNHSYSISFVNDSGKVEEHIIYEGKRLLAPSGFYVSYNRSKKIYAVSDWVVLALQKKIGTLIFKPTTNIDPSHIVELKWNKIRITRDKTYNWSVGAYPPQKVLMARVDEMAQKIAAMQIEIVLDDDNLKKNILRQAKSMTIVLKLKNNKNHTSKKEITIYQWQGEYYWLFKDTHLVYQLEKEPSLFVMDLANETEDYFLKSKFQ